MNDQFPRPGWFMRPETWPYWMPNSLTGGAHAAGDTQRRLGFLLGGKTSWRNSWQSGAAAGRVLAQYLGSDSSACGDVACVLAQAAAGIGLEPKQRTSALPVSCAEYVRRDWRRDD
jgi:hypothetical protein